MEQKKQLLIYSDGACAGNPGNGGCAAILNLNGHRKEIFRGYRLTTNNRMELIAPIIALEELHNKYQIKIYSDSIYLVNVFNKKWIDNWKKNNWKTSSGKPVKNIDLWNRIENMLIGHDYKFIWIKGHNGHPENELCDRLAVAACANPILIDTEYEMNHPYRW